MANRVIQQKIVKMRRMRREWAKRYSMKGTGPVANPGFIADDGKFVTISVTSRSKAGGKLPNPWLETIFKDNNPLYTIDKDGHHVPNMDGIYRRSLGPNANPRAVVLAKLVQSTSGAGSLQGEKQFVRQKIISGRFNKLDLFISPDECFFVEQTIRGSKIKTRKSIVYGNKERAMFHFQNGKIIYKEETVSSLP